MRLAQPCVLSESVRVAVGSISPRDGMRVAAHSYGCFASRREREDMMEQQMIISAEADSAELIRCIDACEACHRICLQMAMNHCLEQGGDHVEPGHFRMVAVCAEVCRTTADAMLSSFAYHEVLCEACSRVCRRCAESCERVGDMQECVDACNRCIEACERITGHWQGAMPLSPGNSAFLGG